MKKWFFMLTMLVFIVIVGQQLQKDQPQRELDRYHSEERYADEESIVTIEIDPEQVYKGKLLLINGDYQLHDAGIADDLVMIDREYALKAGYALEGEELTLSQHVLDAYDMMVKAAQDDHLQNFLLTSGFRSLEQQKQLYEQTGSDYALPAGFSEHNSGLALDISSLTSKMETAPEGKWLQEYGPQYGFILRYPEHKRHITKIAYEPWHFRYVGLPHSMIMKDRDLVLEEYIEYLAERQELSVKLMGISYKVSYYSYQPLISISLDQHSQYDISGDNRGGIIVTSWTEES
ncbi:D-alanyl-D-alanine carboxypeptidase family protein [Paenibacillus septentrionalis]|uniref:D-alanyl-D-alanine carboxypeptidase family protein n=2 Tax=Paenibacillus septentrionalis TaxID=429342 RepID=A0ABW1V4C1_9BACL